MRVCVRESVQLPRVRVCACVRVCVWAGGWVDGWMGGRVDVTQALKGGCEYHLSTLEGLTGLKPGTASTEPLSAVGIALRCAITHRYYAYDVPIIYLLLYLPAAARCPVPVLRCATLSLLRCAGAGERRADGRARAPRPRARAAGALAGVLGVLHQWGIRALKVFRRPKVLTVLTVLTVLHILDATGWLQLSLDDAYGGSLAPTTDGGGRPADADGGGRPADADGGGRPAD